MSDHLDLLRTVSKLSRELSASFDAHLREMNLTSSRARVLLCLLPLETGASQAQVTAYLGVEHPTAVRILDGLEDLGYAQRVPSPQDRRAKVIVLTVSGRLVANKVSLLIEQLNKSILEGFTSTEIEETSRVLLQLLERAQVIRTTGASEWQTGGAE